MLVGAHKFLLWVSFFNKFFSRLTRLKLSLRRRLSPRLFCGQLHLSIFLIVEFHIALLPPLLLHQIRLLSINIRPCVHLLTLNGQRRCRTHLPPWVKLIMNLISDLLPWYSPSDPQACPWLLCSLIFIRFFLFILSYSLFCSLLGRPLFLVLLHDVDRDVVIIILIVFGVDHIFKCVLMGGLILFWGGLWFSCICVRIWGLRNILLSGVFRKVSLLF